VGSAGEAFGIGKGGTNSSLANIVIRDMDFYNIVGMTGISYSFLVTAQGILIENCMAFNSGRLWAFISAGSSAIVRNIRVEQYVQGSNDILIEAPLGGRAASVLVEDCILTTSAPGSVVYLDVAFTSNAIVRNCVGHGAGFTFQDVDNLVVSDCTAQSSQGAGFSIGASSVVIERCVAQYNAQNGFSIGANVLGSLNVIDCVANNNVGNGFVIGSVLISSDAIIFKNCFAAQNSVCGFLLTNPGGGSILNAAFDGCVAQGNGGDGFNLDNRLSISLEPFANISFNNCISQSNSGGGFYGTPPAVSTYLGDGFGVNSATNVLRSPHATINNVAFNNCVAQQNANDGFDFGATGTSGRVDTILCNYCTAENNGSHGMNFSSTSTNCQVYMSLMTNNGDNGINNLNPLFSPSSANRFIANRSFRNGGVDYFQINDGVDGQPFFSSSDETLVQGASPWANLSS
jgi:hypothetical protein